MVLGLMGRHMAPNGVLTGSPGREFAGEADGGVGLALQGPSMDRKFRGSGSDPAGFGRIFRIFFQNGPERSGQASGVLFGGLGGPERFIWGFRF